MEVAEATKSNATAVCNILQKCFETFGVPEEISTDGGPPFNSNDYTMFLKNWDIKPRLSSAYYTPSPDNGASPAELLFGRPINDHLPNPITPRKVWSELANAREKTFDRRRTLASKHANSKPARKLSPLSIGDTVAIQNQTGQHSLRWDRTGIISETLSHEQYRVLIDGSRRTTLRNRRFLHRIMPHTRTTMEKNQLYNVIFNFK